jgi:hypothetical protein
MTKRVVFAGLLAIASLIAGNDRVVLAQTTGAIRGTVEDVSHSLISDATVTITNLETGARRSVRTDAQGNYDVLSLPIGRYSIAADKVGFKIAVENNFNLVVGQEAVVNLSLQVGSTTETVVVTTESQTVNTSTSSTSGLVGEREVKDLPLNGRGFDNLISLNAGAINYTAYSTTSQSGGGSGQQFDVVGRRYEENYFLMNGIEYTGTSNRSTQPGGVSQQLLGVDAVREFNVLTDTYSTEYGKRPGAQIVVVTQSGTNKIHGSAFEFIRNSALDAKNFFDAAPQYDRGRRIPEFQRNQFGGSVGGPLVKDRAFAFLNYEGFRQKLGLADSAIVPDDNARLGLLPNSAGVPTSVTGLNTGMLPFFALWPHANGPDLGGGIAQYFASPKETIREDFATTRFDQTLRARDSLSEAFTFDDGRSYIPATNPYFVNITTVRNQVASVNEVHIFTPNMLNTARIGYSRGRFSFNVPSTVALPPSLSLFAGQEEGAVSIGGGQTLSSGSTVVAQAGNAQDYNKGARNLYTVADDFQWVKGRHQLTIGVWGQRMQENRLGGDRKDGQATFSSLTSFLQGTVSNFQGSVNPHPGHYRLWEGAWYVADVIRLRDNLTISAGLRHEFITTLTEKDGIIANGLLDANLVPITAPVLGQSFATNYDKRLFAPRLAYSWDVFGNQKTAFSGGAGIFYSLPDYYQYIFDRIAPYHAAITFGQNVPFLPLVGQTPNQPAPCSASQPPPCTKIAQSEIPNNKAVVVYEWNMAVEQQIAPQTSLRIEYVGSHALHEPTATNFDSVHPAICGNSAGCTAGGIGTTHSTVAMGTLYVPVATSLPNPYLTAATTYVGYNNSYNALLVDLKKSISHGLRARANYTWAKNLDIGSEPGGAESSNSPPQVEQPFNPHADWGPSGADIRHAVSVSGSYDLPFGKGREYANNLNGIGDHVIGSWQLNTIASLQSGLPFTVLANQNRSGDGDTSNPDRPAYNPNFTGPIITHQWQQWFNPNAFALPAAGTWGNVSKNNLRGPGLAEWDMSLFKDNAITEKMKLQLRAEFFNILNHTNFNFPNRAVFSGSSVSPSAGLITSTTTSSRQIQFGAKILF